MKYINADLLRDKITEQMESVPREVGRGAGTITSKGYGMMQAFQIVRSIIDSIQQEKSIKVYRVENEKKQKGLWRKFDGTWEPLFDMLTDGQCKDMPMEDDPIYREGGKQWFASAPSKETLQKWFSKRDLEELTAKGFTISEIEIIGHKKVSDFEYIFTRDSIISRTYLKVSDIYPQEQLKNCNDCPHCIDRKDQYGWHFKGCFGGPYNGKFIAEIDECPLKQEQPSEDLNDEIKKFIEEYGYERGEDKLLIAIVARHFFELGKTAREEDSK